MGKNIPLHAGHCSPECSSVGVPLRQTTRRCGRSLPSHTIAVARRTPVEVRALRSLVCLPVLCRGSDDLSLRERFLRDATPAFEWRHRSSAALRARTIVHPAGPGHHPDAGPAATKRRVRSGTRVHAPDRSGNAAGSQSGFSGYCPLGSLLRSDQRNVRFRRSRRLALGTTEHGPFAGSATGGVGSQQEELLQGILPPESYGCSLCNSTTSESEWPRTMASLLPSNDQ